MHTDADAESQGWHLGSSAVGIHGFAVPWRQCLQGRPSSEPALQARLRRRLRPRPRSDGSDRQRNGLSYPEEDRGFPHPWHSRTWPAGLVCPEAYPARYAEDKRDVVVGYLVPFSLRKKYQVPSLGQQDRSEPKPCEKCGLTQAVRTRASRAPWSELARRTETCAARPTGAAWR
jgi:hypothetical protein